MRKIEITYDDDDELALLALLEDAAESGDLKEPFEVKRIDVDES